jgi:transmembrane sensor
MELIDLAKLVIAKMRGRLSEADAARLRDATSADAARREAEILEGVWELTGRYRVRESGDVDAALARLRKQMRLERRRRRVWRSALRFAAFAVLAIGLWWLAGVSWTGPTYVTEAGERQTLSLPDGSEVTLNENSRLTILNDWTKSTSREVTLKGEAFFVVYPNAAQPFYVRTQLASVQVLGTDFNVRAYPDEAQVEVEVRRGEVALWRVDSQDSLLLKALDIGICVGNAKQLYRARTHSSGAATWHYGDLYFRGAPMREVVEVLRRYQGLTLDLSQSNIEDCTFTMSPAASGDTAKVLDAIRNVFQAEVRPLAAAGFYAVVGGRCR